MIAREAACKGERISFLVKTVFMPAYKHVRQLHGPEEPVIKCIHTLQQLKEKGIIGKDTFHKKVYSGFHKRGKGSLRGNMEKDHKK